MKLSAIVLTCLIVCAPCEFLLAQADQTVVVNASAPAAPFPHFWEQMFGSGRAILSLRSSYRQDLRAVKKITGFQYIRFHGIFLDEVGVYSEDKQGNPHYNFTYVDQIYDGLLQNGVRPFVEIGFMPKDLAQRLVYQGFWYKPISSPPKDYAKWDALIQHFVRHLVDRYGIDEVSKWYFEVWNEPNMRFWAGRPAEETYFKLYDHTARDIKAVSPRLRVGGPATARAAWVGDFIAHTVKDKTPVDFISSHTYEMDRVEKVFGPGVTVPPGEMVYLAVKKMHDAIAASARPNLPLIVSEFSDGRPETGERDTLYMGPWLANVIRQCDGLTRMMSFWPFSDVYEEHGVPDAPFDTTHSVREGRGLIGPDGVPKPSFVAFELLHRLGHERIPNSAKDVIVTRRKDGALVIALWNLVNPGAAGSNRSIRLELSHLSPHSNASVYRLDQHHEDTLKAYRAMGSPRYPTPRQVRQLWQVARIKPSEQIAIERNRLTLEVPPNGLVIVEISGSSNGKVKQ